MDYTTDTPARDGFVFAVGSLYGQLSTLTDQPDAKGKRYSLALVLLLVVRAELWGEDTPSGIAEWAKHRCGQLVAMLQLKRPTMPCHNTYRRVLRGAVGVAPLQAIVSRFLAQASTVSRSVLLAIDGKIMRGAIPVGATQGVHLLAAHLPGAGVVLMQVALAADENEISAAPRLLALLDLRGKVVRGDAMLTQRELSVQILAAGGDYLWLLKENQPTRLADIQEVFDPAPTAPGWGQAPRDRRTAQTVNNGHGRLQQPTLTARCFRNDYRDWPGLAQVFKLERRVTLLKTGVVSNETTYGITSLTPAEACPRCLLKMMRDYWGIENGLHHRRDKTLREDAARMTALLRLR